MSDSRQTRLSSQMRRARTRYRPTARIAVGGMAEVWRGDAILETGEVYPVAIKRVLSTLTEDKLFLSMFMDEARLGMLLRHPNIVRVHDAREVAGTYIMIMELVDGCALRSLLERAHARGAPMPIPPAVYMVRELLRALDYAHRAIDPFGKPLGIIHRDVSPHNLLLGKNGTVKLADFGLADARVHQTMKNESLVGGKLGYLAPEIARGSAGDQRVDLFAAGVVLWEAVAGRRLFQGETDVETLDNVSRAVVPAANKFNAAIPRELDAILTRALAREPDARYPSAQSFGEALDTILGRHGAGVGAKDMALLVGLHNAATADADRRASLEPLATMNALMAELDAFVAAADGLDAGAEPLDPSDFAGGPITSGVRSMPVMPVAPSKLRGILDDD